ncbi:hypothetical protein [Jiella marina]|uniref:hypothetical protein n=1 Tax=Jiella sp. LLJ827 TaxID=2917712 RepID=UPI00210089F4|nr:hypothetical protein [Jiella sp. LLJ827]MCQ0986544.1 hypothetical protein [Jiella sp. LLJ827]
MTKMNETEARQGQKGTPILMILVAGLALCAIVFVGLGLYGWAMPDATLTGGGTSSVEVQTAPGDVGSTNDTVVSPDAPAPSDG